MHHIDHKSEFFFVSLVKVYFYYVDFIYNNWGVIQCRLFKSLVTDYIRRINYFSHAIKLLDAHDESADDRSLKTDVVTVVMLF